MKKLFTILLVFAVTCMNPYDSFANPLYPAMGTISEIYIDDDGGWFIEVMVCGEGYGEYINIESSQGSSSFHTNYNEIYEGFYVFTNNDFEDFEFDPDGDYIVFLGESGGIETVPVIFGNYEGSEIPALHNGCALVNKAYDVFAGSDWTFDGKPTPYFYSDDFMPGNIKLTVLDYDQEPMGNMAVNSPTIDPEYFAFGDVEGIYYPLIRCDLDPVSFMVSDLTNTYAEDELFVYPGDTVAHTISLDINNYSSFQGTITLEDNSSPIGSKILLTPINPQNESYQGVVEREDGFYNLAAETGIYQVCVFNEGFAPQFLLNGVSVVGSVTEDFELSPCANCIYHETENEMLSGSLDEGIHYLFENVVVPEDEMLVLNEHTEIHTVFGKQIFVNGQIQAMGTCDNEILFSAHCANPVDNSLFVFSDDYNLCQFSHCSFENFPQLFTLTADSIFMENCNFHENKCIGELSTYAYLCLQHCFIQTSEKIQPVITLFQNSTLNIFESTIDQTGEIFLADSAKAEVAFSIFMNMDNAIVQKDSSSIILINSLFNDNETCLSLQPTLDEYGLNYVLKSQFIIKNSLFLDNENGILVDYEDFYYFNNAPHVEYNCFWNNDNAFPELFLYDIGELSTINLNGDSCDNYKNIFLDPKLDDDFHLTFDSPCINAGDPDSPKDPDSTIIDIGPFFYDLSTQIGEYEKGNMTVTGYPNPAKEKICFDLKLENDVSGTAVITLYNLNGVVVAEMYEPISSSQENVTITMPLANRGINAGLYIYSIIIGGNDAACGKITVVN